jgi:hypothetical protein
MADNGTSLGTGVIAGILLVIVIGIRHTVRVGSILGAAKTWT